MSNQRPTRANTIASIAVFVLVCAGWGIFATAFSETGLHFPQFYITASIPIESIYDRGPYEQFGEDELAPLGLTYYPPYVRPAVFALPLRLLAPLSYRSAQSLFAAFQFALFLLMLWLLSRRFDSPWYLMPLLALFPPTSAGIITGQDPHTPALLALSGFLLLEKDREVAAGLVWSLCLYKFGMVLGLPLLLLLRGKWKALGAFAAGGAVLAAASIALAPPSEYLALLGSIENYTTNFSPAKNIGLRGVAHVTDTMPLYPVAALLVAGFSVASIRRATLPTAFTVAVLGSMLCSYHVNWYDAVILAPSFVYIISERRGPLKVLCIVMLGALRLWMLPQWIAGALLLLWAGLVFGPVTHVADASVSDAAPNAA